MIEPRMVAIDLLDHLLDDLQESCPGMDQAIALNVVSKALIELCEEFYGTKGE